MSEEEAIGRIIEAHSRKRRPARPCIGHYIVGYNARNEALCLCWQDGGFGHVDREVLRAMFEEARGAKFRGPIHVHGATTSVGETDTFRFYQEG